MASNLTADPQGSHPSLRWKHPGIVTLFDAAGNILGHEEPIHTGSPMLPVNWRGNRQEFVFLSGNPKEGGMIAGRRNCPLGLAPRLDLHSGPALQRRPHLRAYPQSGREEIASIS